MTRPVTTLFMLSSLDGRISTGDNDSLDFDRDFPDIKGLCEGLHQYYDIEQTTDLWSLNSGRVQKKMGVNEKPYPQKSPVSFVLIDNSHLNQHGVKYFCALSDKFVLVTQNKDHPAFSVNEDNLHVICMDKLDLSKMLCILKEKYGCERLTVQSGGTLNSVFLREKLIDFVDIVIAPTLIGGKGVSSICDGEAIHTTAELCKLSVLELVECTPLEDSYVRLRYKVI